MLCGKMYLHIHNIIFTCVHWEVLKDLGAKLSGSCLKHEPQQSTTCGNVVVMYDHPIIADQMFKHNNPGLCIWDKEKHTVNILDVAVPMDKNVIRNYA